MPAAVALQLSLWWHWLPTLTLAQADMALFVVPTSVALLPCLADPQLQQRRHVHVPAVPHRQRWQGWQPQLCIQRSSSDVIAVFDADFIIKRHFLTCMLPHRLEPTYERPFEYRLSRCGELLSLLAAVRSPA